MLTFKNLGKSGRFANQLFQIASVIGIAIKNKQSYIFPNWQYSCFFKNNIPQVPLNYIVENKTINIEQFNYVDIKLNNNEEEIVNFGGYLQTEKYFLHCNELIRNFFCLNDFLENYINKKYSVIFKQKTCSIHVRRTDYLDLQKWHPLCSVEYYKEAIDIINEKNTLFLIFSDDIKWCKKVFIGNKFVYINEENVIDMFLMSRCNDNIIANSSFSWWSAWLNSNKQKRIICPKIWFGEGYNNWNKDDLIPETWRKI